MNHILCCLIAIVQQTNLIFPQIWSKTACLHYLHYYFMFDAYLYPLSPELDVKY